MTESLPLAKSEIFRVLARSAARRRAGGAKDRAVLDRLIDHRAARKPGEKEKNR